jgi:hypothetical protein
VWNVIFQIYVRFENWNLALISSVCLSHSWQIAIFLRSVKRSTPVNSIYLPGTITFSHLAVKKWSLAWETREQWRQLSSPFPRHIVRQFQSPYTSSPRSLSRISARQVALALASRFSRMLSFRVKDMEFTGPPMNHSRAPAIIDEL